MPLVSVRNILSERCWLMKILRFYKKLNNKVTHENSLGQFYLNCSGGTQNCVRLDKMNKPHKLFEKKRV